MLRRRLFPSPIWGTQTFIQNFNSTSFVKNSGGSYNNLANIGGSNSTTYATLSFATGKKASSSFEFAFKITDSDIPTEVEIESVKIDFKWGYSGKLGNGGTARGSGHIYTNTTEIFTTNRYTTTTISAHVDTEEGDMSEWSRDKLNNIRIVFDATAGNNQVSNPQVQFYGATITVKYHLRNI